MKRRTTSKPTVETYTLTLIHKDGSQTPVGRAGHPASQPFHHWTEARDALAAMVLMVGGVDELHAAVVTMTQARGGELLIASIRKYNRDEVAEFCFACVTSHGLGDGRRVNVTIPQ